MAARTKKRSTETVVREGSALQLDTPEAAPPAEAIDATPPPKPASLPLWAWGALMFGAYKLLGKPGRR